MFAKWWLTFIIWTWFYKLVTWWLTLFITLTPTPLAPQITAILLCWGQANRKSLEGSQITKLWSHQVFKCCGWVGVRIWIELGLKVGVEVESFGLSWGWGLILDFSVWVEWWGWGWGWMLGLDHYGCNFFY